LKLALLAPRIWDTIFYDQACALARLGHQVVVYTEDDRAPSGARFTVQRENGVEFWVIHGSRRNPWTWAFDRLAKPWLGRRFFTTLTAIIRFLRRHRDADAVFVEGDWIGVFAAIARGWVPFRWLVTVHDTLNLPIHLDYPGRPRSGWQMRAKMWVLNSAGLVRANSPVTRDALVEAGCDPARIVLVPLHIPRWMRLEDVADLAAWRGRCRQAVRPSYGIPLEAKLLVTMCRLTPVKGLELAVEALAAVGDPDYQLLVCGGDRDVPELGSYRDHLSRLAERLGVGGRTHFSGNVPISEVKRILAAADLHLAPSVFDTFNYAVVEATLVETPSLMSDKVGAAGWIAELGGGEVLASREPAAWGARIRSMTLASWPVDGELSRRCLERFSPDGIATELVAAVQLLRP
jgi:glycosyltransferase involved in cell wall biosynthesis